MMSFLIQNRLGGLELGKWLEIWVIRRLVKISVYYICFLRTVKSIGNQKENRTLMVRCIFWWEWVRLDTQ